MDSYKHLTPEDRSVIYHSLTLGLTASAIAKGLGRNRSCISREINRNKSDLFLWQERAQAAQTLSEDRISKANSHPKITESAKAFIEDCLVTLRSSPLLIAGNMKVKGRFDSIGKDAIYRWIKNEKPDLLKYLPKKGERKISFGKRHRRKFIKDSIPKVPITERPPIDGLGTIEGDTMHGIKGSSVLSVHCDKVGKLVSLSKLSSTNSSEFLEATLKVADKFKVQSFTFDNGPETYCYPDIMKKYPVYFCAPYHSWEKGTVERIIQNVRLFIPKGFDIDKLSDQDITAIEHKVNSRPMKCLNFLSPFEFYQNLLNTIS